MSCFEKGFTKSNYQEYITYKFVIKNKTNKNIRAVKGSVSFTDLFDEEIKELNFVYDDIIQAGKTVNWNASTDYNMFMDDDKTLVNKDLENLKVV